MGRGGAGHEVTLLEPVRGARRQDPARQRAARPRRDGGLADWRPTSARGAASTSGSAYRRGPRTSVLTRCPDAVIVATGGPRSEYGRSKSHPMPVAGSEQDWVIDHERALRDADASVGTSWSSIDRPHRGDRRRALPAGVRGREAVVAPLARRCCSTPRRCRGAAACRAGRRALAAETTAVSRSATTR